MKHALLLAAGQEGMINVIFLVLIIVVFYFFMIRPQMKRQKEARKFREALQKGDKVVTIGGIYGRIAEVKEDYVMLEIDTNVKVKVDKNGLLKDASGITEQQPQQ